MDDRVCICAPTTCSWCCCTAVRPWIGTWVFTTAVAQALTGGAVNWCCAGGAGGGLGDCDRGISC